MIQNTRNLVSMQKYDDTVVQAGELGERDNITRSMFYANEAYDQAVQEVVSQMELSINSLKAQVSQYRAIIEESQKMKDQLYRKENGKAFIEKLRSLTQPQSVQTPVLRSEPGKDLNLAEILN